MTSRVNLDNQAAVILHQYDYRNSSLIVNFFMSNFGKVSAIAKGVKGKGQSKSRQNQISLFQPFQKLMVSLTGKQDLLTLKNIELSASGQKQNWQLRGKSLYCAYYINELLLRLLPSHTDCQEIFSLYQQVLDALAECSDLEHSDQRQTMILYEAPLRFFELNLLELLGYGLNLINDISSDSQIEVDKEYFYNIESGPSHIEVPGVKQLHIGGNTLINLNNRQLSDEKTLQEGKLLLKWAINEHLANKPLKSRELFKQLYGGVRE